MSSSWVVVQNAEEVERALALEGLGSGSHSYLAVSAAAYFGVMERGLPCRGTHEFATRESTNELATKTFVELRGLTNLLDDIIHERTPDMPEGFKPFEASEYDLNKLLDSASFALMELSEFVRAESPSDLLYWDDSQESANTANPRLAVGPGERTLTSRILDRRDWWARFGVETRRLPGPSAGPISRESRGWSSRLREILNPNRTDGFRTIGWTPSLKLFRGNRPRLLVIGSSDNSISFVKYAIETRRAQIDWWPNDLFSPVHMPTLGSIGLNGGSSRDHDVPAGLGEVMDQIKTHSTWGHDQDRGPVGTVLQKRLLDFSTRVPRLSTAYKNSLHYFQSCKPSAVICGTVGPDIVQVIQQAARASGVPMASFQHGGAYGYMQSEWMTLSDLRADLYVGYGADGCGYLEGFARSRGLPANAFSIGWSRGAAIASALKEPSQSEGPPPQKESGRRTDGRRVVMYVPTGLGGERRHGPDHGYHDTEYCLEQVRVIEALRRVPDAVVMIKLHPKDATINPIERWVRRLGDDRVKILVGGRLPEALARSDLVVLDCPTTTLLEVMAMGSRLVYLHLGILKWTPEGESLMRKTAPWVDVTPGWETRLVNSVVQALDEPALDPSDNRFLEAYASLDFQPDRVWDKLQKIQSARAGGSG